MEIQDINEAWEGHTGQEVENFIKRSFDEAATVSEELHTELTQVNNAQNSAITSLETALYPLQLQVSVLDDSGISGLLYKKGTSVDLTLSATVTHKGNDVTLSENTQYLFSNVTVGDSEYTMSNKYEFEGITSTCKLKVEAKYSYEVFQGVYNNLTTSQMKTITFVDPSYIGFSNESENVTLARLTEKTIRTIVGTYKFGLTENGYLWICIPTSGVTGFTKITLNGFDVPMEDVIVENGYRYHRTSSMLTPGEYTFILS